MPRLRYGSGRATVEMDDTMDRLVRRALDEANPGVLEAVEREAQRIHAEAYRRWPVKTGRSKAALDVVVTLNGQQVRASIVNDSGYAKMIKPKDLQHLNQTAWQWYVRGPVYEAQARLVAEIPGDYTRALSRG